MSAALDELWDRAIAAMGDTDKPAEESFLKTARARPDALIFVEVELADATCPSCGPLEECPSSTAEDFAKREALRALAEALRAGST